MAKSQVRKVPSSASRPKQKAAPAAAQPAGFRLDDLFGRALQTVSENRQAINQLDGQNGNHGDNMVENLRLIMGALQSQQAQPPAKALSYASTVLKSRGRGGTSQYYARGLEQAAQQLQGQSSLDSNGVMTLVQSLLGAIPDSGFVEQPSAQESVLGSVLGLLGGAQQPQQQPSAPDSLLEGVLGMLGGAQQPQQQPSAPDSLLEGVLGMLGGAQQPQPQPADDKLDAGDVLGVLLPAGVAFMQARQAGADPKAALGQALISALLGGRVNPLQARSPRAAAGGLIAQSILQALTGQR